MKFKSISYQTNKIHHLKNNLPNIFKYINLGTFKYYYKKYMYILQNKYFFI